MRSFWLTCFLAAGVCSASDWPMYLRDLAHSSYNPDETQLSRDNISTLAPAWTFQADGPLASGVTVADGVLYFGDWAGYEHAVSASDGTELWKQFVGMSAPPEHPYCQPATGVSSQGAIIGGTLYVGGGDSAVYALDKTSGEVLARIPLADPQAGSYLWSSVMTDGTSLYIGVASLGDCPNVPGQIVKLDVADLEHPIARVLATADWPGAGVWSTPALDTARGALYVGTGNGDEDPAGGQWGNALLKVDQWTLEIQAYYFAPALEIQDDLGFGSSPTLFHTSAGEELVGAIGKDGTFVALRRDDMTTFWIKQVAVGCADPQHGCGSLSTPAFDGKALFFGGGVRDPNLFFGGSIYAVNPDNGETIWENDLNQSVIAPVTVANGLVYAPSQDGLTIFAAETGEPLWNDGERSQMYGQAPVVDGTVYAPYINGELVAYRASAQTVVVDTATKEPASACRPSLVCPRF